MNYKHLYYFWVVATAGSIAKACKQLHLAPQTISAQIGTLEKSFDVKLLERAGKGLELTEAGRMALRYADEIFSLGAKLEEAVRQLPSTRPTTLKVGITDVVPKSISFRLLAPVRSLSESVYLDCREDRLENLLAELAIHRLDLVIADQPMPATVDVRGFNHLLGKCGISFFATKSVAAKLKGPFPQALHGEPLLLPSKGTPARMRLLRWLGDQQIYPRTVGEFEDSALMKVFGQAGTGVFFAPTAIEKEVTTQYRVEVIGRTEEVLEEFFVISVERRITNPAIAAITNTARTELFQDL